MGRITLKINNISVFMTKTGQRSESPRHQVAGIQWYIRAYPQAVDNVTYLSCYLRGENANKWTASVDATFRIVKKNGDGFGEESSFRADLLGKIRYYVTDVCGASLNVFDVPGALAADVGLKVGDSVFHANKGYLTVVSPVFRDVFALTDGAERKEDIDEVELEDPDPSEFREFLGVI
ncbi:hypothetical protein AAVH_15757 [Aphelenchoides avenae]|nr:hypothetical protein AAVH_15757 [Aphelenchus avenae]